MAINTAHRDNKESWSFLIKSVCVYGTVPVSYTHLDVYKRQSLDVKDMFTNNTVNKVIKLINNNPIKRIPNFLIKLINNYFTSLITIPI